MTILDGSRLTFNDVVVEGNLVVNGNLMVMGDTTINGAIVTVHTEVVDCNLKEAIDLCKENNIKVLPIYVKEDNKYRLETPEDFKLDAVGNKVYIGDTVAFAILNYRGMQKAKVTGFTNKGVKVRGIHHYGNHKEEDFNRMMYQVVKVESEE